MKLSLVNSQDFLITPKMEKVFETLVSKKFNVSHLDGIRGPTAVKFVMVSSNKTVATAAALMAKGGVTLDDELVSYNGSVS